MADSNTISKTGSKSLLSRLLPLLIIAAALGGFFAAGLDQYVSLEALKTYRGDLTAIRDDNFLLSFVALIIIYAALVAISFPGAGFLTIFAGFLFGPTLGSLAVVIGATIGATTIFRIASTSLGEPMRAKAGPWLKKFEDGFKDGELSYLFVLRLVPLFPFWLVNIAPAFLGASMRNYVLSTFFGIIPGTVVFSLIGAGAGTLLDKGEELDLAGVLTEPTILGPIIGLAILALIPVIHKKLTTKKTTTESISS